MQESRHRFHQTEPHVPQERSRQERSGLERVHSNLQHGRLPKLDPSKRLQAVSSTGNLEENGGPRMLQDEKILPPPPTPNSHTLQRPRSGGWAKSERTAGLNPDEMALRQSLQKDAIPKPPPPIVRISHSPQISSLPGYPSRPDAQTIDPLSDDVARTSPFQTFSTQQQRIHEGTSHPGSSEYRQARDAQLDHHIAQSRKATTTSLDGWFCRSCANHNFSTRVYCNRCQARKPFQETRRCGDCGKINPRDHKFCSSCGNRTGVITSQIQPEYAERWEHIKRLASNVSPKNPKPDTASFHGRSDDTQAAVEDIEQVSRRREIEQEKMKRMERTKGGEFIALRSQHETAKSKAMKASYWSQETSGAQVSHAGPINLSTPDQPQPTTHLVDSQVQSAESPQMKETRGFREEPYAQETSDDIIKDPPGTEKLTGGWKRWVPFSAGVEAPLAQPPQHGPFTQIDGSTHSSSSQIARQQNVEAHEVPTRGRDGRTRREPQEQGIARQHYERAAPHPANSDRNRLRKSKDLISNYDDMDEEDGDREARRMERKEQRKKAKALKASATPTPIYLPEYISVTNLAGVLRVRVEDFIRKMKDLGFEETSHDHILDAETAGLVAAEFNFEPIFEQAEDPDLLSRPRAEDKSLLPPRPPVVTIMGHVDHGKTTLLDYLRKSSVAASEHGGITQHIGAFSVLMPGGRLVTFLDTPGHEAFLSMRQRGANVTDIVILVVAADDSVKPQTIEAIRHAQAAKVPIIVAINKIDKEDSNAERVKQDLARYGVEVEDYGGDTQAVCVSGKTGQGMEELEDAAVALADILDMRAETDGQAEGWILEATTKKAGRVATVLVRRGTLRPGDIIVAGTSWARVRSLRNEAGVMLKSAGPGTPVEIDGWREQPAAGDEVIQAPDEQKAKAVVNYRLEAHERIQMATDMAAVNETRRLEQEKREEIERAAELAEEASDATAATSIEGQDTSPTPSFQEVFFVVKADVSGSVEAVTNAVSALGNSEVRPHILRTGVGPVTEFDVDHAAAAKGHIISFNTTADGNMQRIAEAKEVKIINQSIIYRLVDDVKAKLSERLPDIVTQKVLGEAEIAQIFEINTKGRVTVPIAGCRVKNGVIGRNNKVRVLRGKETIYDGTR